MHFLLLALIILLIIVCFLMILTILMQRPRNEGLGAAFGGGLTDNLFGTQTTKVLTKLTVYLGGLFFLVTLIISVIQVKSSHQSTAIQRQLLKIPAPQTSPSQ